MTVNLMVSSTMRNQTTILYYTPVTAEVICSSDPGLLKATATTTLSFDRNGKFVGVSMDGTSEDDAKHKLIEFFSDDEEIVLQLID